MVVLGGLKFLMSEVPLYFMLKIPLDQSIARRVSRTLQAVLAGDRTRTRGCGFSGLGTIVCTSSAKRCELWNRTPAVHSGGRQLTRPSVRFSQHSTVD